MESIAPRRGVGMILGKFLPPHAGHQALVHFGMNFVDRLHVLVCSIQREPIPGQLRYAWMRELFPEANVVHIDRELPQEPKDHPQFWDIWREVVREAVGESIDYVFASEEYGRRLAADFVCFDLTRNLVPVSGTAVRESPLENWRYIPECVRPYFLKRICVFGPESTGKSMLARDLAAAFGTAYVPEFARGWLDPKRGVCSYSDIDVIARGQLAAEDSLSRRADRVLFCDTDLLLTTIWSDVLFGRCPEWIARAAAERRYDLYLLLDVDVPWVDDTQRFLPHRRREFFERCRDLLEEHRRPYVILSGTWPERFARARQAVETLLAKDN